MISISLSQDFSAKNHTKFIRTNSKDAFTNCIWSPILWKDNYRAKANFESCRLAVFDFDNGVWGLEDALTFAKEIELAYLIGTTKSHQKEKKSDSGLIAPPCDRFRLILKFERPITSLSEYEFNMRQLMQLMPVDISCKDGARFFYPCREIWKSSNQGEKLPVLQCPPEETLEAKALRNIARAKNYAANSCYPAWVLHALNHSTPEGERHLTAYKLGAFLYHFGKTEEEILSLCMKTNLADIGLEQLTRAVCNGYGRAEREAD